MKFALTTTLTNEEMNGYLAAFVNVTKNFIDSKELDDLMTIMHSRTNFDETDDKGNRIAFIYTETGVRSIMEIDVPANQWMALVNFFACKEMDEFLGGVKALLPLLKGLKPAISRLVSEFKGDKKLERTEDFSPKFKQLSKLSALDALAMEFGESEAVGDKTFSVQTVLDMMENCPDFSVSIGDGPSTLVDYIAIATKSNGRPILLAGIKDSSPTRVLSFYEITNLTSAITKGTLDAAEINFDDEFAAIRFDRTLEEIGKEGLNLADCISEDVVGREVTIHSLHLI